MTYPSFVEALCCSEAQALKDENRLQGERIAKQENEIAELKDQLANPNRDLIEKKQKELEKTESELNSLTNKVKETNDSIVKGEEKLKKTESKLTQLSQKVKEANKSIAEANKNLSTIESEIEEKQKIAKSLDGSIVSKKSKETISPDGTVGRLLELANSFLAKEDYEGATKVYENVQRLDIQNYSAFLGLILCDAQVNSLDKLIELFVNGKKRISSLKHYGDVKFLTEEDQNKLKGIDDHIVFRTLENGLDSLVANREYSLVLKKIEEIENLGYKTNKKRYRELELWAVNDPILLQAKEHRENHLYDDAIKCYESLKRYEAKDELILETLEEQEKWEAKQEAKRIAEKARREREKIEKERKKLEDEEREKQRELARIEAEKERQLGSFNNSFSSCDFSRSLELAKTIGNENLIKKAKQGIEVNLLFLDFIDERITKTALLWSLDDYDRSVIEVVERKYGSIDSIERVNNRNRESIRLRTEIDRLLDTREKRNLLKALSLFDDLNEISYYYYGSFQFENAIGAVMSADQDAVFISKILKENEGISECIVKALTCRCSDLEIGYMLRVSKLINLDIFKTADLCSKRIESLFDKKHYDECAVNLEQLPKGVLNRFRNKYIICLYHTGQFEKLSGIEGNDGYSVICDHLNGLIKEEGDLLRELKRCGKNKYADYLLEEYVKKSVFDGYKKYTIETIPFDHCEEWRAISNAKHIRKTRQIKRMYSETRDRILKKDISKTRASRIIVPVLTISSIVCLIVSFVVGAKHYDWYGIVGVIQIVILALPLMMSIVLSFFGDIFDDKKVFENNNEAFLKSINSVENELLISMYYGNRFDSTNLDKLDANSMVVTRKNKSSFPVDSTPLLISAFCFLFTVIPLIILCLCVCLE